MDAFADDDLAGSPAGSFLGLGTLSMETARATGVSVCRASTRGVVFTSSSCKAVSTARRTYEDMDEEFVVDDLADFASSKENAEFEDGRRCGYVATEPDVAEDAAELRLLELERELANADSFDLGFVDTLGGGGSIC